MVAKLVSTVNQQREGDPMRELRSWRFGLLLITICLVGASPVLAQTQKGTIEGTVTDPNGEALPRATVTLSGSSVMGTKTAVTSANGSFRFPVLPPGDGYRVELVLGGFSTVTREGLRVSLGQTTNLAIAMELAAVQDEIVVSGETPMVDTTSPTVSTHFGTDMLENIPRGRAWEDVLMQTPGIVAEGDNSMFASSRGGSVLANETAFDGVSNTDPVFHTSRQTLINETVQEIQVVTGALPAEVGNVGGAYVNAVTKSGGNEFHGEVAAYFNNESWQSDNLNDDLIDQGVETTPTIVDYKDYAFNLGGPIVRDKLWFNVAYWKFDQTTTVNGFPPGFVNNNDTYFGKITWQPSASHSIFAMYNQTDQHVPWWQAGPFTAPEGNWDGTVNHELAKVQWNAVLSDSAFLETAVASSTTTDHQRPHDGATWPYLELTSGYTWGSAWFYQDDVQARDQAKVALSLFKDDWAGSHSFKFGIEYQDNSFEIDEYQLQPVFLHLMLAGDPFLVWMSNNPNGSETKTEVWNAFAQDTWRLNNSVTLNLGLRVNKSRAIYPAQSHAEVTYGPNVFFPAGSFEKSTPVDWTTFDPRLGAVIALDDQGKSVLRLGLARYHHQMAITYLMRGNPNFRTTSLHGWADTNGDSYADPDELFPAILFDGGNTVIDPDLDQPYTDEITIGYVRELFTDFSLTVSGTWRKDGNLIEEVDSSIDDPDSWAPMDVADPGPDQIFGTSDDQTLTVFNRISPDPIQLLITNPERLEREYKGIDVVATKRLSNNWQALASIVWSDATGNLGTDWGGFEASGWSSSFFDPNSWVNRGGPTNLDREWQFKVSGTYFAPLGFSFSGFYQYNTGIPLYRTYTVSVYQGTTTVVADPWDTWRLDKFSRLDLRAEKAFKFGQGMKFDLILDVFNVFNENSATARNGFTGAYDPFTGSFVAGQGEFERAMAGQAPRLIRLGARFRF